MGSPACYVCCRKEMLGQICEKMATLESAPRGGKFSASDSTTTRNGTSACNDLSIPIGDYSIVVGNGSWNNAHTFDSSSRGKRLGGKPSTLVQHAQRTGGSLRG
jgi:hypothetical protein